MRLDDLKTWILANLPTYLGTLDDLVDAQIVLRELPEPGAQKIVLFLHEIPEPERVPFSSVSDLVRERIEAYFFAARGGDEAALRTRAAAYADALKDCIATHADYMDIEGPEHFDGVEGNPDIKATKYTLVLEYED